MILNVFLLLAAVPPAADGLSIQRSQAGISGEPWGDLDRPAVGINRDQPSVEQSMQVTSEQQSSSGVVFGLVAVEVKVRGF